MNSWKRSRDFASQNMEDDTALMKEAIALARQGLGRTAPNPPVGALVVKDGEIAGKGFHPKAGMPHAEIYALQAAGLRARDATLYVTLEPCNHHGRTPPCTQAIIEAGIGRVVIGTVDPNPKVAGRGIERLQGSGLEVTAGVCRDEADDLISWYATWLKEGRPYVILKAAITLDGRIAASSGDSRWISSEESRTVVHELRDHVDGIIVGVGTVVKDDPLLTCRIEGGRDPMRIILDTDFAVPAASKCLGEGSLVFTAKPQDSRPEITERGAKVVWLEPDAAGMLPWEQVLAHLGGSGLHAVMVEGGSSVYTSLLESRCVDKLMVFIAPKILGSGIPLVSRDSPEGIAQSLRLVITEVKRSGPDILVEAVLEG
jgi:diaminohydroxyphosphoribosylaminopyrimidine deaminase/5-amino-6-(5-phosphoribosylamino)uracil reductase